MVQKIQKTKRIKMVDFTTTKPLIIGAVFFRILSRKKQLRFMCDIFMKLLIKAFKIIKNHLNLHKCYTKCINTVDIQGFSTLKEITSYFSKNYNTHICGCCFLLCECYNDFYKFKFTEIKTESIDSVFLYILYI